MEYIGIWEKVYNPNFNYGEFAIIDSANQLESMNSELIKTGKSQSERALYLNKMAIEQLTVLYKYDNKLLNEFNE